MLMFQMLWTLEKKRLTDLIFNMAWQPCLFLRVPFGGVLTGSQNRKLSILGSPIWAGSVKFRKLRWASFRWGFLSTRQNVFFPLGNPWISAEVRHANRSGHEVQNRPHAEEDGVGPSLPRKPFERFMGARLF